ncbi:heavy metal transporter [Rhodanobacter sp. FW510-R12]|jgi:mercuric ion binding protein|uniref:Heavy-metal-associated domain-containing protein n=6 Tax=Gammaproteobacteria TaxID=1236 RepID=A0A970B6D2_9GAMM|nr:heavy metal transporter [Rhodanobacter sp. FW104-R8]KZC22764.1 heavy metal transporter [Rhodanobacter thiooxydans]KZC26492.1 heavy metal transporter [Rhodanobacter sp. FW510-T8]KZC30300.1 heavy metal transporter [Rhodanobacter sp. FW510-R10]NKF24337.1 heavy-metal-associated domain-containing protein [Solimonas marina]RCS31224.1 copper chaperone [Rhodanobacter denitrificans]
MVAILGLGMAHAATPTTAVLHAANMTCPSCSVTIKKALSRIAGVTSSKVDLKAETVTVTFDADRTTESTLARTVTEAGFPATAQNHGG